MEKIMSNKFIELFGDFSDEKLSEVFSQAEILNVRITMETKTVEIDAEFPCLITKKLNDKADYELARMLQVEAVKINSFMPAEIFSEEYWNSLGRYANEAIAATNGFFRDSKAKFDGEVLSVELAHGGGEILKSVGAAEYIEKLIKHKFRRNVTVSFTGETEVSLDDEKIVSQFRQAEENNLRAKGIDPEEYFAPPKEKEKKHKIIDGIPLYLETAKPVYGTRITTNPKPLNEITPDEGTCTVWGEVFDMDVKETKDHRSNIVLFNITDNTYAYSCKVFEQKENCEVLLNKVKNGVTVLIRGYISYDKFSGENIITPRAINLVERIP